MKFSELYRLLEKNGWEKTERKNHHLYVCPGKSPITVGRHQSKEVPPGTLNNILKNAGLK